MKVIRVRRHRLRYWLAVGFVFGAATADAGPLAAVLVLAVGVFLLRRRR